MKKHITFFFLLLPILYAQAQPLSLFRPETLISEEDTLLYRIMFPVDFDANQKYPLILFLHGAGERGNDNEKQLIHGSNFFAIEENRADFPAVVVFPQCPEGEYWARVSFNVDHEGRRSFYFDPSEAPSLPMKLTIELLEHLLKNEWIERRQVYVGGLSMGGMGTFELLYRMPEVFAAAFPICGGGNPDMINKNIRQVNVWAFHGEEDTVVPQNMSVDMLTAYLKAGARVKLSLYPGVGHNAWDYAFTEPELLPWLFSNQK